MKNKSALWIVLILILVAGVAAYFLLANDSSFLQGRFNKVGNLSPETSVQDLVDQGTETAEYVCGNVWRSDGADSDDTLTDEEKKRLEKRVETANKIPDEKLREESKDAIFDDCETAGGSYNQCKDITGCWDPFNPNEYP